MTPDPTDQLTTPENYTADPFLCWRRKVALLRAAVLTSQSALETAKAFMVQQSVAAADADHFEHPITEINKALDIIEQLNLLKHRQ